MYDFTGGVILELPLDPRDMHWLCFKLLNAGFCTCEREDWISVLAKIHGNDSVKSLKMVERLIFAPTSKKR